MNERDIELAKKAGWEYAHGESGFEPLWKFADLIRADEREACAVLAQQTICDTHVPTGINIYGTRAAKAIRARGQT
jgi:hypothetical protein